jgi:uncharacterized membrane protein YfcA
VSALALALGLAAAAAAGVVRGFSGFGSGLVLVPALTLLAGPAVAVPVAVLLDAIVAAQLVPGALAHVRWPTVLPLGLAAAATIPAGGLALAALDPDLVRRAISAVVLVVVAVLASGWRYRREPSLPVVLGTGAASGLLTGLAGVGGPPVILFYLSGREGAPGVRSGLICYFAITQAVALASFAIYGLIDRRVLLGGLLLAPAFLAGAWIGTRLFGRVDAGLFRRVTLAFLAVVALFGLF